MYWKVEVRNWYELKSTAEKLNDYVFRGHADKDWPLSSKFERDTEYIGRENFIKRYHYEHKMLKEFKRYAHQYVIHPPKEDDLLGWLSILQHHGGSTRLLDFTQSLYIATFFAVEKQEKESAVWAVNKTVLAINTIDKNDDPQIIKESLKSEEPVDNFMRKTINKELLDEEKFYEERLLNKVCEKDNKLAAAEPAYLHERLVVQQGVFLFAFNLETGFEKVFVSHFDPNLDSLADKYAQLKTINDIKNIDENSSPTIIKFILPKNVGLEAFDDLRLMNITAASLFPGLDGYARSLNFILRK